MKRTRFKALTSLLIAVLGSVLLAAPIVKAQSSSAQISPTKTILSLNSGDKKQVIITVQNSSPSAAKYNALFDNFTVSDEETGEPKIIDDPTFAYGIKNWLTGPTSISVAAMQEVIIRLLLVFRQVPSLEPIMESCVLVWAEQVHQWVVCCLLTSVPLHSRLP